MNNTPAEMARKFRDLHEKRADARAAETGIERARAKAWTTFEHAVNGLEKTGCLGTVTITITDTTEPDSNELEHCYSKETQPATATPIKVGDKLQKVVATDLPVGSTFTNRSGDGYIVADGYIKYVNENSSARGGFTEVRWLHPYTITYIPDPEPTTKQAASRPRTACSHR